MGLPNVMQTGLSGMVAAKTAIATTGHNITNANSEGFSRQRVELKGNTPNPSLAARNVVGQGVAIASVSRVNDEYLEKKIRNGTTSLSEMEEKDMHLNQLEDVFNELNDDGLNRLMANFFNQFRKLANDPDNEAVRQSVREASQAMVNDFKRLRQEVVDVSKHIDNRIEAYSKDINSLVDECGQLNVEIKKVEMGGGASANDLKDRRDVVLKKIASYMSVSTHTDKDGSIHIDIPKIGPLLTAHPKGEEFSVERSPRDAQGKPENAYDVLTSSYAGSNVTHSIKGGKMGALLDVRDKTVGSILDRLDELAFSVTTAVNDLHRQGFTRNGGTGVEFFKNLQTKERAAEYLDMSAAVKENVNNIAAAAIPDAPGDNRIATALGSIQGLRILNGGKSTADDFYNSIVNDVGIISSRNKTAMSQEKTVMTQLGKMRDQLSGVSLDEETANLLQFQQAFGASAKVIQVADQMLDEVLNLRK